VYEIGGKLYRVTLEEVVPQYFRRLYWSSSALHVRDGEDLVGFVDPNDPRCNEPVVVPVRQPLSHSTAVLQEIAREWKNADCNLELRPATRTMVEKLLAIPISVRDLQVTASQATWRIQANNDHGGAEGRVFFSGEPPFAATLAWLGFDRPMAGKVVVFVHGWGELDMVYLETGAPRPQYVSLATGRPAPPHGR
jgi:hypothetical protein